MKPEKLMVKLFRISQWAYIHKIHLLAKIIKAIIYFCGMNIDYRSQIGEGFIIHNGFGLVIGREVKAGKNLHVSQGVTVGGNWGKKRGEQIFPIIGNNVWIMAGSVVVGPIKIGDNVVIGANSVVTQDVPDNVVLAGAPARIIREIREYDINLLLNS